MKRIIKKKIVAMVDDKILEPVGTIEEARSTSSQINKKLIELSYDLPSITVDSDALKIKFLEDDGGY